MTTAPASPKPQRPWLIIGILGFLVVFSFILFIIAAAMLIGVMPFPVAQVLPTPMPVIAMLPSPTLKPTQAASPSSGPPATLVLAEPTMAPTIATLPPPPTTPSPTRTRPPAATPVPPPSGKLAFSKREGDRPEDMYVWIMNMDGSGARKLMDRASEPTFSPDGSKVAFYHWTDGIFVMNADGTGVPQKILGDTRVRYIEWSHNGRYLAITSLPYHGNAMVEVIPTDGSALRDGGARRLLTPGQSPSWSPDDTIIAIDTCRDTRCGIFKIGSAGGDPIPIIADGGGLPAWSPDGTRIVYQTEVSGASQLFIINVDGSGKRQMTSGAAMHVDAVWSRDGRYIFYRSTEGGPWGVWRMNADGSSPIRLIDNMAPVDWPYERLTVSR